MDILHNLQNNSNSFMDSKQVEDFRKEVEERLAIVQARYTIDRFEGNVAICEDRQTGEMKEINREDLPKEAREGMIIKQVGERFEIDEVEQDIVSKRIKNKMDNLWNN